MTTTYTEADDLSAVFLGRRIVAAEKLEQRPEGIAFADWRTGTDPVGLLTLDDGTKVYAAGHEGGCGCSAGCYYLETLATTDNVITKVEVEDASVGDGDDEEEGAYRIFVYCDATKINAAEFTGTDGNGYYGTGFHLSVVKATA